MPHGPESVNDPKRFVTPLGHSRVDHRSPPRNCLPNSLSAMLILAERIKHDWDFHVIYDFIIKIGSLSTDAFKVPALSGGSRTLGSLKVGCGSGSHLFFH